MIAPFRKNILDRFAGRIPALPLALLAFTFFVPTAARADNQPKFKAVSEFSGCVDRWGGDACLEALQAFVTRNPGQAFEAGRTVTFATQHWAAMPLVAKALATGAAGKRCSDDRLALAVTSAFGLPNADKGGEIVAAARDVLVKKCWTELQPVVVKELDGGGGGYFKDNLCPVLAEQKVDSKPCTAKPVVAAPPPPRKWEPLDGRKIDVEPVAKVFRGAEGRRVTLVKVKDRADTYLVKFEGFDGPWNGRVVLHRQRRAGSGHDYFTDVAGADFVSVVARERWGGHYDYEIYPKGDKGPYSVGYDETASKEQNAKAVLAQYAQ